MINRVIELIGEVAPYEEIVEDTQLIEEGILDSLSLVIVIDSIQEEYGIEIPEEYLQPDFFKTPQMIVEMVERLKNERD